MRWGTEPAADSGLMQYRSVAVTPLLRQQQPHSSLYLRLCFSEVPSYFANNSVGAGLSSNGILWKIKLRFVCGYFFFFFSPFCFFWMTFENAEGYTRWKSKVNPSFAFKLRRQVALLVLFCLVGFCASSSLNEFPFKTDEIMTLHLKKTLHFLSAVSAW